MFLFRRKTVEEPRPWCPKCGSSRVARIEYGLLDVDDELQKKLDQGDVMEGGCCISDDDPFYHCWKCDHEWRDDGRKCAPPQDDG
jgi:hypothetical protein